MRAGDAAARVRLVGEMSAAAASLFPDLDDPTPTTAWAYRHAARRLRSHFGHDRVALHRKLKALALNVDAARLATPAEPTASTGRPGGRTRRVVSRLVDRPPVSTASKPATPTASPAAASVLPTTATVPPIDLSAAAAAVHAPRETVDRFAALVVAELEDGVLRHSRRRALLGRGVRMGLGLFEANLVIAAVQHRHPRTQAASSQTDGASLEGGRSSASATIDLRLTVLAAAAFVVAELSALALLVRWHG